REDRRWIETARPADENNAVYDAAGGFQSVAVALQRADRHHRRQPDRGAETSCVGRTDRILCQFTGPPNEFIRGSELRGGAEASEGVRARSLRPPGCTLRAVGGATASRSQSQSRAVLPSAVCTAECARANTGTPGAPMEELVW